MEFQSSFLKTLATRGFIHQQTDEESLDKLLAAGSPVPAYIGFDCTAPSLHVGSLMQIMVLRWLQKCGHKPVVLMGGGTTKVGDPSGKDESRKLLDAAGIQANVDGIKKVFSKYLTFGDGPTDAVMVNNADWLDNLNYIEFLRDYGRHFSVNKMLSMESVKLRLEREQHLSFLEFNYMILQAYDFVELNKRLGVRIQFGGSDQWGNIINGVELQRKVEGKEVFGLTTPLLTTSTGAKMGKTADGAVWMDEEMLSPYEFWQFWRNTADADVPTFLKFFTEFSMEEIEAFSKAEGAEINEVKKKLATHITALCHGAEAANAAEETARQTFEMGGAGGALPEAFLPQDVLLNGLPAYELFAKAELAKSNGEARKLIRGKGAKIQDVVVEDENQTITFNEEQLQTGIKLSAGKKRHILLKAS